MSGEIGGYANLCSAKVDESDWPGDEHRSKRVTFLLLIAAMTNDDYVLIIEPDLSGHRWRYAQWAADAYIEAGYRCLIVTERCNAHHELAKRGASSPKTIRKKLQYRLRRRSGAREQAVFSSASSTYASAITCEFQGCPRGKGEPWPPRRSHRRALRRLFLVRAALSRFTVWKHAMDRCHHALDVSS